MDRIQHIFHVTEFITLGSQKWQGAIPNFITRLSVSKGAKIVLELKFKAAIIRAPDARA